MYIVIRAISIRFSTLSEERICLQGSRQEPRIDLQYVGRVDLQYVGRVDFILGCGKPGTSEVSRLAKRSPPPIKAALYSELLQENEAEVEINEPHHQITP